MGRAWARKGSALVREHESRVEPHRLVCVEPREVASGDATGWRAYLSADDELTIYCPKCARHEFDDH